MVGGLIAIALIVAIVLWVSINYAGGDPTAPDGALPDAGLGEDVGSDPADPGDDGAAEQAVGITGIVSFDPDGDDGIENEDLASEARADDDAATGWRTVCYSNESMGSKRGVGLVVSLASPIEAPVRVDVANGPYRIEYASSSDPSAPTTFDGWGEPFDDASGSGAETVTSESTPSGTLHVLVTLTQIGLDADRDPTTGTPCSTANPYRGGLAEISVS